MSTLRTFLLGIPAMAVALAGSAAAQVYALATNPQGSVFYSTGASIAKLMVEKTGLQFRVAPYAGSSTYVPLISSGQIGFGLVNAGEAAFAYDGREIFKGRANPNIREVLVPFANDSGYAVKVNSPIRTIADLKGRKVPVGYVSGRIFHYLAGAILATAGLTDRDLDGMPVPGFVDGINAFAAGRVDAAYITLNAAAGREAMATIPGGWRYLSIGRGPDVAAAMNRMLPSRPHAVRPGRNAVGVVDDPTVLLQVDFNIIAAAEVPDDVVYRLAKTMYENKPALVKMLGAFNGFDPKHMAQPHPTPYHPGAIRFYREVGLWPPK
jgi:TRAP transporter TAXI family solute receptor